MGPPSSEPEAVSSVLLERGWCLVATPPGAAADPGALDALELAWTPALVPGTAAGALRAAGAWSLEGPPHRFDAQDWWFRVRFPRPPGADGAGWILAFDGLATIADVWLNGAHILRSESMFIAHEIDVSNGLRDDNVLAVRFASLDAWLASRPSRPRPRWRAPMIESQSLRWARTTVLGRTPGWSPPAAAVGPWRPVRLVRREGARVVERRCRATVREAAGGIEGTIEVAVTLAPGVGAERIEAADVRVHRADGAWGAALVVDASGTRATLRGRVDIPGVELWWPHTHGEQPLYDVAVAARIGGVEREVLSMRTGFRSARVDTADGGFAIEWNGVPIFCRGACWTPVDVVTLRAPRDACRETLEAVRAAGMNMVRVGGTMVDEDDTFLDLCDEMGILVWQDFMFANMDFPEQDAAFVASVRTEAGQLLQRWQGRPSLAALCGDSEGEQQAAMWGAPRESWHRPLFRDVLPRLAEEQVPDVPYWPSSASGGAFPHQPDHGTCSYYGVGAYLRPFEDARRSGVRFATECLAFANVPDERSLERWSGGAPLRAHQPRWKERTPRDLGAGWDFDDVRDHYLERIFDLDPVALRSTDPERYLELSRVASGEAMARAFSEWRRRGSCCRGALVWFLRDLWPGAGWGLIDGYGRPKPAYHFVRRALQPVSVGITDEGLNGLALHVVNERPTPLTADLRLDLYRRGETRVGGGSARVTLAPRETVERRAAALLEGFTDTAYAYRFGPAAHDLAVGTITAEEGAVLAQAFHATQGWSAARDADLGITAEVRAAPSGGGHVLDLRTRRFAQAIAIDCGDLVPEDNFFHLPPGGSRRIRLRGGSASVQGVVKPLNADATTRFQGPA